jgi:hypothetical protein
MRICTEVRRSRGWHALTQALRQGVPPAAVTLAHARRVALQFHPLLAPEYDTGPQTSTSLYIFQPPIVQLSRMAAVYFWQMEWHMHQPLRGRMAKSCLQNYLLVNICFHKFLQAIQYFQSMADKTRNLKYYLFSHIPRKNYIFHC